MKVAKASTRPTVRTLHTGTFVGRGPNRGNVGVTSSYQYLDVDRMRPSTLLGNPAGKVY
jgi:hypothetical protein